MRFLFLPAAQAIPFSYWVAVCFQTKALANTNIRDKSTNTSAAKRGTGEESIPKD